MSSAQAITELERQRDEYRSKAIHWRAECDNRDRKIHELEQFLRSIMSRIQERLEK